MKNAAAFGDQIGTGARPLLNSAVPQPLPFETAGSKDTSIDLIGFAGWILEPLLKQGKGRLTWINISLIVGTKTTEQTTRHRVTRQL